MLFCSLIIFFSFTVIESGEFHCIHKGFHSVLDLEEVKTPILTCLQRAESKPAPFPYRVWWTV